MAHKISKHEYLEGKVKKRAAVATAGMVYAHAHENGSDTPLADAVLIGTGAAAATFAVPLVFKATLVAAPAAFVLFSLAGIGTLITESCTFINDVIHFRDQAYWDRKWERLMRRIAANQQMRKGMDTNQRAS